MVRTLRPLLTAYIAFLCIKVVAASIKNDYFLVKTNKSAEVTDNNDPANNSDNTASNCELEENAFGTKRYNKTCQSNSDCNYAILTCKNGLCGCLDNYYPVPSSLDGIRCERVPTLMQPCSDVCQKPLVCKPAPVNHTLFSSLQYPVIPNASNQLTSNNYQYPSMPNSANSFDDPMLQKLCQCDKPYVLKTNFHCVLILSIGETCEHNLQCQAGFSECKNNRCLCRIGFENFDGVCKPTAPSCPFDQPLMNNNSSYVTCTKFKQGNSAPTSNWLIEPQFKRDDCPEGYFCLTVANDYNNENVQGHCCPNPNAKCPVGFPHATATCQSTSNVISNAEYCPTETHYCYSVNVFDYFTSICCPKTCPFNTFSIQGKCYPILDLGDPCVHDEQCSRNNMAQCINGLCKCGPKSNEVDYGNGIFCVLQCDWEKEASFNGQCYSYLKVGDLCETEPWRCPSGSLCNKRGKCSCQCGLVPVGRTACAVPPVCFQSAFIANELGGSIIPPAKQADNVTFCKIKGKQAPLIENVVDECSSNHYCSPYISTLGLCCPKPARLCPFGQMPVSKNSCNGTVNNCATSEFCHILTTSADLRLSEGICCPASKMDFLDT